jgi:ABC-type nitrate/sulfonate/bicarbonate transport system ATPase subunit
VSAPRLTVEGLAKTFPGGPRQAPVHALDRIDLDVAPGELVALVGPSGCGKSTLLGVLAGLLAPSRGRVLIDGREPDELLGRAAHMPQKDLLMPWRTVLGNVALPLELRGMEPREARERARAELPRFGLAGCARRWPFQLSGGMRQRAALLRTFLSGRDLLLLDEPFGALDALTRQAMQEWLLSIWQEDRKTIVLVTHDVEEAIYLADRVHVMSARPARIERTLEIDLPRPRTLDMTASARFGELKGELLEPLREAVGRQMGEVA